MGRLKRKWRKKRLQQQDNISLGKLVACAEWEPEIKEDEFNG